MQIEEKSIFVINSNNRTTGSHSNFSYKLDLPRDNDYNKVVLLQALIPKSYYVIQDGRNTFTLKEDSSTATVTLTPGNYNRKAFQSHLTLLLNAASPNGYTYSISYPDINTSAETGKLTYNVSGNSGIQPEFIFTTYLYEQLGFDSNSTNVFSSDSLTSTNVINLQKENSVYVRSNICDNKGENDILQTIFGSNDQSFSYINYECQLFEAYSKPLVSKDNNVFDFTLTDENGNVLDTNGVNVILVVCCYRENRMYKLVSGFLKYQLLKEN